MREVVGRNNQEHCVGSCNHRHHWAAVVSCGWAKVEHAAWKLACLDLSSVRTYKHDIIIIDCLILTYLQQYYMWNTLWYMWIRFSEGCVLCYSPWARGRNFTYRYHLWWQRLVMIFRIGHVSAIYFDMIARSGWQLKIVMSYFIPTPYETRSVWWTSLSLQEILRKRQCMSYN